jgi:hypothetical protein
MDDVTQVVLGEIRLDEPWGLVEAFASQPREKPDDANRGADLIALRLRRHGVPVTVHEPEIYLSLPIHAEVRAAGRTFHAKPPAFAASRSDGVTAPLLYLPGSSGGTPLDRNPQKAGAEVAGKVVIIEGFALPNYVAGLEAAGAAAVIAVNPGQRIHWGTVSTIWGTATTTAGGRASATTAPATPACSRSRACCGPGATSCAARSASPGGPATPPAATAAAPGSPTASRRTSPTAASCT